VVLTGTDLYQNIQVSKEAQQSLEWATKLVVLQNQGLEELPEKFRKKTQVIYQSATKAEATQTVFSKNDFNILVVANLRQEKDPFRTALAAANLPLSSKIKVFHVGLPLNKDFEEQLTEVQKNNPRYTWLGSLPSEKTKQLIASTDLVSITSKIEGGSNVLCEALAAGTPVLASKISSLVATLGYNYSGFFTLESTKELTDLLIKAETNPSFYKELKEQCQKVAYLVDPLVEKKCWEVLLNECRK
jgi:glycosyltransferase involved in cell wall biosynthesis